MIDEEKLTRALELAGNFSVIESKYNLYHPSMPLGYYLETDNLGQKGNTIFVFECKAKKEQHAIRQLQQRYESLMMYRNRYIIGEVFTDFKYVRLFYCSFKRKALIEFDPSGNKVPIAKFEDVNELAKILRNI